MTDIPDAIEPIIAIRNWFVRIPWLDEDRRLLPPLSADLYSLNQQTRWTPGVKLEASCLYYFRGMGETAVHSRGARVPVERCTCGFYAAAYRYQLPFGTTFQAFGWGAFPGMMIVTGIVELTGKVIVGERGWRAQYAKLAGLFMPNQMEVIQERTFDELMTLQEVPLLTESPTLTDPKQFYPEEREDWTWTSEKKSPPSSSNPSVPPSQRTPYWYQSPQRPQNLSPSRPNTVLFKNNWFFWQPRKQP